MTQVATAPKYPTTPKELYPGLVVGYLKLLKRVRINPNASAMTKRKWRVICSCGNEFTIPQNYLIRKGNPKTHCGCKIKTDKTIYKQEYGIWSMMRVRCTNESHVAYRHYGGRGISVCPQWFDKESGFAQFLADMGTRPSPGHSLDRIDVDGNYQPGNVRWATAKEQAQNTRKKAYQRKADKLAEATQ